MLIPARADRRSVDPSGVREIDDLAGATSRSRTGPGGALALRVGSRRALTHRHATLAGTYLNALTRSRLALEQVDEPAASALLERQQPLYAEVPIFFAARARLGYEVSK